MPEATGPARRPPTLGVLAKRRRRELLSVEDWDEIRRLHRAEGLPIKTIARTLRISRNTVCAALAAVGPPKYERRPAGSAVDAFEDAMPCSAQGCADNAGHGDRGAGRLDVWVDGVQRVGPRVAAGPLPPDPAGRTTYEAGDIAQCDLWFPPTTVPVGFGQMRTPTQLPVLTMVTGIRGGSQRS